MKNPHAVALGRLGKGKTSKAKAKSSRQNGKHGGRPPTSFIPDWISFMDSVDDSRRAKSVDPLRQLFLKSHKTRERALLNATAKYLCWELNISVPDWASQFMWLKVPWFVSGVENLKAMALLESPIEFRANNIFVLENFLSRV